MTGCADSVSRIELDTFAVQAVPVFPAPHPDIVVELKHICPQDKCRRLYDWMGKLMVFEKQLTIYRRELKKK